MSEILFFEPFLWNDIVDYPDLGAAYIQGALKEQHISSKLVCTQLQYIKCLFLECACDIEEMFQSLSQEEKVEYPTLCKLKSSFKEKFAEIYQKYYSHVWAHYMDAQLTSLLKKIFIESNNLQFTRILKGKETPILFFLKNIISSNSFDVICLSCYELTQFNRLLIREIRKYTSCRIVLGGAFTSHLTTLEIQAIIKEKSVDYLVIGPGERALPELIRSLDSESVSLPLNVVDTSKRFSDCLLTKKPLSDLDKLPFPDFTQSQMEKYPCPVIILPIQTARGCTYRKCTFCSHHHSYYGEYHVFPVPKVVEMIVSLAKKHNCNFFVFHDEEISCGRLHKISSLLIQKLPDIKLSAYVRADSSFMGENMMVELYSLGVRCLNWGIESGSQTILDRIKKGIDINNARMVLSESYKVGISNTCWMMINIPGESNEDFEKTLRFMIDNTKNVHLWLVSPFRLQYDSPLYSELVHGGRKKMFCTSVEPTQEFLDRERKMSVRINALSSMGLLFNDQLPMEMLPQGCQRSRLLPFVYLSSIASLDELNMTDRFQIFLSGGKLITIGSKCFLTQGRRQFSLEPVEVEWIKNWNGRNLNLQQLDTTQKSFIKKLFQNELIKIVKSDLLWDMQ